MFSTDIYRQRRHKLIAQVGEGLILLPGNLDSPFNSPDNCYRFRQDSSFLYFCGLDQPDLAVVLDVDSGEETLYGAATDLETGVWSGVLPSLEERAAAVGIARNAALETIGRTLQQARAAGRKIHLLPTCRGENRLRLAAWLGTTAAAPKPFASAELIRAVVALRSVKEKGEIAELDAAADLGRRLHLTAMKMARPGQYEWRIAGELEAVAAQAGRMLSFPPIVTVHGEILHNRQRHHRLQKGDLLLVDAGVESSLHYASDHTRTVPVGGVFSRRQKAIYWIVLAAMDRARELIRPGVRYLDVHLDACRVLILGLQELGLMRGDADAALHAGAHALFMPHGLGHMLGLDVHDMEDLGEDFVGYDEGVRRRQQFGLSNLRLGRELREHFALTVEPGIYFIPELIRRWRQERRCEEFINYAKVPDYLDCRGIRLENDVLVTAGGNRLLGRDIPLRSEDVENAC